MIGPTDFVDCLEVECEKHEGFLTDLLQATGRPLVAGLAKALTHVTRMQEVEAKSVASRIVFLVRALRRKKSNLGTGSRTSEPVKRLAEFLSPELGQQLKAKARHCMQARHREASIARLYGVPPGALTVQPSPAAQAISSSSEDEPAQEAAPASSQQPSQAAPQGLPVCYYDGGKGVQVRAYPDGSVVLARMECGPDGFWRAQWPDGSQSSTEVPNLQRVEPAPRAFQAVLKKPAKAFSCSSSSSKDRKGGQVVLEDEPACAAPPLDPARKDEVGFPSVVKVAEGTLRRVLASRKSYITLQVVGEKKHLLVGVEDGMAARSGKEHQSVIRDIFGSLAKSGHATKEKALELRRAALSS